MVLLEQPDISMFTDEQIGILNLITNVIAPLTAHQLRQMTDDDPLCKEVENYECMLIATGSVITRPLTANGLLAPN
jgi:hypothetical protein